MEGGTEETKHALERMADALEKLASDPEIEIEFGPPLCPHCGKINPTVQMEPTEAERGPMLEIIFKCYCMNCNAAIYVCIESFSCHKTVDTLQLELEARKAGF